MYETLGRLAIRGDGLVLGKLNSSQKMLYTGRVYTVQTCIIDDEIIIKDIGPTSMPKDSWDRSIEDLLQSYQGGHHLLTPEEWAYVCRTGSK